MNTRPATDCGLFRGLLYALPIALILWTAAALTGWLATR